MSKLTRTRCFLLGGYLLHLDRVGEGGGEERRNQNWCRLVALRRQLSESSRAQVSDRVPISVVIGVAACGEA